LTQGWRSLRYNAENPGLSQHRSENMIPKSCADAVVSRREFMMASVMLEQRKPQMFMAVMRAVMYEQVPGIGN
jgi:hypothetical protein